MNERSIVNRALEQLKFQTGLVGRVSRSDLSDLAENDLGNPSKARVKFDSIKKYLVTHLQEGGISGKAMQELLDAANGADNLVISDYVNDEEAEKFRESNINYLDNVGNAYLNIPPIYVLIQGKKPRDSYALDRASKLFTETGLRVILALLINESLLNSSYRRIADHAGVSMGTIGWVLRELKSQGFTTYKKGRYAWALRVKLVKMWVDEYPALREKYSFGRYFTQDSNWWKTADLSRYEGVLGGDVTASKTVREFTPSNAEVFVGKHKQTQFIRDLGLIPASEIERLGAKIAEQGLIQVEVLSKFWGHESSKDLFTNRVHPILTYASLMDSWNPKSRELAAKVAREFL